MEAAGTGIATHPTTAGSKAVDKKKKMMMAHQLLLPVSMGKKLKISLHLPFPVVQLVSGWSLLMALVFPISCAVAYALISSQSHPLLLRIPELTETQAAQLSEIWGGRLLCTTVQAAAAALALWLPCHHGSRIRRAFAYVALVATAVHHGMYAATVLVVLPAFPTPGDDLLFRICPSTGVFLCLVLDLLGFLALVFLGGGDEED
ncbi:hypothetical protein U9M48_015531 [Paspalum notatum var. saurae]|uniref:Uncharacterized protein n=1 Tax=Paspalum notatum var. saurae TaxID=547442 RepID=A0AAQ3T450_PASNO